MNGLAAARWVMHVDAVLIVKKNKVNRIFYFTLLITLLSFQSCSDMLEEDPTVFVGKIYLQHSHGDTYLIYTKSDISKGGYIYDVIVKENVILALGNDSVIYVKTSIANVTRFYIVKHDKGETLLGVKNIDSLNFAKFIKGKEINYLYKYGARQTPS